ncbi:glycoside hydrolase family 3 C-terminal domain-containing protein [Actinomycetaceae bacterium MB13-C1-2]|nr:glycoside hydrolase family 3 C-terminal domain-containing protein [Actinomycetaceae bacterium MB13-C1-2]
MSTASVEPDKAEKPKKKMTNRKFLGIWVPILAVVLVLLVVANIAIEIFKPWIGSQLGQGEYTVENSAASESWDTEYYKSDYEDIDQLDAAAGELISNIAAEGVVLAKNESAALPLPAGAKVTMLGRAAADPVYGGQGSGSVDITNAVDARSGLENAGLQINEQVYDAIASFAEETPRGNIVMDKPNDSTYNIGEMPASDYAALSNTFADYGDAALVFIGRGGGEGGDLTQTMEGWDDNYVEGQHQLQLNKDELDLINLASSNFDRVIVLINASTTMELGAIQDNPEVDSVLLIGSPGLTGFNGVGQVVAGQVNPSGRTVDIWASDFSKDPTWANFGDFIYENVDVSYPMSTLESTASNADITSDAPFVNYAEGIYIGYRYYETADAEGFIKYDDAVVYPFGYGLSYTDFEWSLAGSSLESGIDGTISVDVEVKNNGTVPGKDVVEVYYTAPYTRGGIEKPEVVLAAFAKTGEIAPGESETVTLKFAVEDMASYDYKGEGAYVLEKGDYRISVRSDSHTEVLEPLTYVVDETKVYSTDARTTDEVVATNQFDSVSAMFADTPTEGKILNFSRADFAGTFPQAPTPDLYQATPEIAEGFTAYDFKAAADAYEGEMPATGQASELTLVEMRGLDWDDPKWDEIISKLTVPEMTTVILNGAYQTGGIPSIAKPLTMEVDGPAGFSSFINSSINGPAYPSEVLIAQTWNLELGEQMGLMLGNESLLKGVNGWYAPAANLHRSPFGGRNFEYYSEDPLLSGDMMTAVSNGAAQRGLYTAFKHFVANEQETNRVNNGVATWVNEQALREVYLKPFEIAVKGVHMPVTYISDDQGNLAETEVGATFVMSSFNRVGTTWTGGDPALMRGVLRDEWGFRGFAITDFNLYPYMNPNQGINAGSDLMLTFAPSKSLDDTSSALAVTDIQNSTKAILYTVANSNAMNDMAPGATVTYHAPAWVYIQWAVTGLLGVAWVAGVVWVIVRVKRHSKAAA